MIGCLTLPFRLLGVAIIVLALVGGWLYRDRIVAEVGRLAGGAEAPAAVGHPTDAALRTARAKVARLERGAADSVVLDAGEAASLVGAGLDPIVRDRIDSLEVRLGGGRIAVGGMVETGRLPVDLVGPLAGVLRDRERIIAGGPLGVAEPGRGRWVIDQFQLRDFPFPRDVVPRIVERALGDEAGGAVSVRLPAAVRDIRVEPQHVILYGGARP
jgi:hypothetical protein